MDNNTIYHIINTVIAAIAVIVAVFSYRSGKVEKSNDVVKDLEDRITKCERGLAVLEERISNLSHLMDKLDNSLGLAIKELNDKDK